MAAFRFMLCVCVGLVTASWLRAEEPSKQSSEKLAATGNGVAQKITTEGPDIWTGSDGRAVGHARAELSGRRQLENQLQLPAGLDFGDRKVVALHEIFDQLNEKYGLSIRFDTPVLASMLVDSDSPISHLNGATTQSRIRTLLPRAAKLHTNAGLRLVGVETASDSSESTNSQLSKFFNDQLVDLQHLDTRHASVATILSHALNSAPAISNAVIDEDLDGLPILLTNAGLLDYVVENECVLVTSRMNALMLKETRVYSLKELKDVTPEQLSKVIRQSVRPWSWRSQADDSSDQPKSSTGSFPSSLVNTLMKTGGEMVSVETGISPEPVKAPDASSDDKAVTPSGCQQVHVDGPDVDGEELLAVGRACLDAAISMMEMAHYAETPTGTIQVLPGKLVITQSQSAHREIADLLKQLADE